MPSSNRPFRIVFIHLDWGIGGAESLMLQLALASSQHDIQLVTTRCDPSHCFEALKPPHGKLYAQLCVWGSWIPASIMGKGQAMCSTLRLLYITWQVARQTDTADLVVLDVLPTPLWVLRLFTKSSLLFYCHFPDQLLIRNSNPGYLFSLYRSFLNWIEGQSMHLADTITVNSKFTKSVVLETFPSLFNVPLPVLYPALDESALPIETTNTTPIKKDPQLLVSLNRYERKKNLDLFLQAAALLQHDARIVIAGGYDTRNTENVEYRAELGSLAKSLGVTVEFRLSISDAERHHLLTTAAAVVYTPANEHFGIVPIEAMSAGTAVVCCNSGGPTETVQQGVTGFLCDPTPEAFAEALNKLLGSPSLQRSMGEEGPAFVRERFGMDRLQKEWDTLVEETVQAGRKRKVFFGKTAVLYSLEAGVMLVLCWCFTLLMRGLGVLESHQSVLGGARRLVYGNGDEL